MAEHRSTTAVGSCGGGVIIALPPPPFWPALPRLTTAPPPPPPHTPSPQVEYDSSSGGVASASYDKTVRMWSVGARGREVACLTG